MQTLARIKALLDEYGLRPRKSLGQHFLIDQNLIRKLVDASGARKGSLVLEVGPGTGALTEALLARGCETVACELDAGLARLLCDTFAGARNLMLIEADCLESKRELSAPVRAVLGCRPFTLVANLPYNVATPLILTLLTHHPECAGQYVTIQREVADRLVAGPGTKAYGAISVVAQCAAQVRLIARLPRECFWPRPDVASAMVAIERREDATEDLARLAAFCRTLFASRRKQLRSALGGLGVTWADLPEGINPSMRAEELSPEHILALHKSVHS